MPSDRHLLALSFASGEESLSVRRFCIDEGLSRLFTVDLVAIAPKPDIDLESIVGHPASFRIMTDNPTAPERLWSGICSHFELVHGVMPTAGVATEERSTYYLRIVPSLWVTTQRRENRIFQQQTLPEIVQSILDEWKIKAKWELKKEQVDETSAKGSGDVYRKHDFVVQYGESDFRFICRLLERAGITFLFRFRGSADTELIFSDLPHEGAPRSDLPIDAFDTPPLSPPPEYLTHVRVAHTVQPGTVTFRDYDFRRSYNYLLEGQSKDKVKAPEDFYEQYGYRPGESLVDVKKGGSPQTPTADDRGIFARHDDDELKTLAQRHLESLRKHKSWLRYESNCPDLAPGVLFSVARHPRTEITTGKQPRFLVAESFLEGTATGDWTFGGKAAFTDCPWVPDQTTLQPRIYGMQSALVVGPPGRDEIHTDEFGRVRVQFHWDREGKYDDKSSCWVRVSQDWAGAGFGTVMLPRIGQEVLVAFYEGDPDHPVVVGRVYNDVNKVPYKLPEHETRTTWKTDSSPQSDGFNEVMFEDFEDKELLYVQAEKDLQKLVKAFETARTGHDRVEIVGRDRSTVVAELDARMVADRYLLQMMPPADDQKLKVQTQEVPKISPTRTAIDMVDEQIIFTTGQATVAFAGKDIRLEAKKDLVIHAKGGDVILEGSHAYFNTLKPASPPKVQPFEALKPGTYSSQAADTVEALQQKAKRDQEGVDLAAPDAPAWDGSQREVEEITCHLVQTQIFCEHDKSPRMPDKETNVLEVTSKTLSDTITLKAKRTGACLVSGEHPEWKISGPDGTEILHGESVTYKVKTWKLGGLRAMWPARTTPKTYAVYVKACTGASAAYRVLCYPNDKWKFFFELKRPEAYTKGIIGKLRDALAGFLTRCGGKNANGMIKADDHMGFDKSDARNWETMSDAMVELEFLKGRVGGEAQWTEWPDDHRCFWKWQFTGDFFPLLGVKVRMAITPKVPWPLSKLADGYLFVEVWGRIEVNIGVQRKTPETTWQVKPKVEAYGGVRVRLGAHVHLISKKALFAEAWGETDVGIKAAYDDKRSPLDKPAAKFTFVWKGFNVGVWITFAIDWSWLKFKKCIREEWLLLEGVEKPLGTWEFWPKDPASADRA